MIASDNDITLFAKTNFRNREVPFGIRRDDRRRHMYIIGKTGMGKTTLIENMVIQDILNGHGVCFVDPHGDSVEKVLDYIPANRINDVIYLNPADLDFPIAFNPLEAVDPKHKHLVASGLMAVFTKMWAGVWSPRMEYILQNTILALLDSPGNTLLGVARMYVDKVYRKKIVDNIKDPVVKSFWVDEFANYQDKFRTEAVAPIQNKVGQLLSNAIIRNIVGQTKSSIDLREVMDQKKILLLNLSKGRIGENSSALLGAMIITKLQMAAMSRVDVPEEQREDYYLYVDEFQNFATESFANILSEARKYRLNLIVAHQYIGQLVQDRNTVVRDAIFGNVGTMITFRVGADDAEFLEKEFEPVYTMNDLVNLSKWNIYLKLMINGVASSPFSASTLPPIAEPTANSDKVIRISRERYATPRLTVEQKISKWLGAEFHAEAAKAESDSVEEEGVAEDLRFRHAPPPPKPVQKEAQKTPVSNTPQNISAPAVEPTKVELKVEPKPEQKAESKPAPQVRQESDAKPGVSQSETTKSQQPQQIRSEPQPFTPPDLNVPPAVKPQSMVHNPERREDKKHPQHERRQKLSQQHNPGRRSSDKAAKPVKHENPIWETVTKLTTDKIKDKVNKTNQAIEALSKSLQASVTIKDQPIPKPAPKIKPPEPITHRKIEEPKPVQVENPEPELPAHKYEPIIPEHHVHPENPAYSPHHNIQDVISKHGSLEPGETIKFD